jgi:hypothetical protein
MLRGAVIGGSCAAILYAGLLGAVYQVWVWNNPPTGTSWQDFGSETIAMWALSCSPLPVCLGALLGAVIGGERHDRGKKR